MFKSFILAICFLSLSLIGLFINKNYRKRAEFYKDYYKYLTIALESVRNTKQTKEEITEKVKKQTSKDFGAFLTERSVPKYIKRNEQAEMEQFFDRFGGMDLVSTMELLQDKKTEVEGKVSECEKQTKSKGGMILKLCILGGLALVILLI